MKKARTFFSILVILSIFLSGLSMAGCAAETDVTEELTLIYDLNYENAPRKELQVKPGIAAKNWTPSRKGYSFVNWFTDPGCDVAYDFSELMEEDTTLYAGWKDNQSQCVVSIDLNYEGAEEAASVLVDKNQRIDVSAFPESPRLGMEISGWYLDAECTQAWNADSDIVTEDIALYADYTWDDSVPRDSNGNIVFENVVVDLWTINVGTEYMEALAGKFNSRYSGKITVNVTTNLSDQKKFAMRMQQIPELNRTIEDQYYTIDDVYNFAGISYSQDDWFENAMRDSYCNDKLYSMPLMMGVPFIVYNESLMNTYNGASSMPDSFSQFQELLTKANAAESEKNPEFDSITSAGDWSFKEATSYAAFVQNGADYYIEQNGEYVNTWDDNGSANAGRASLAMSNLYELFGVGGSCGGRLRGSEGTNEETIALVSEGKAFMGLVNSWGGAVGTAAKTDNVGILPLSGLFSDDSAYKDLIPVHTIGFQFYKAEDVSPLQIAAAAVFADFVSKNSESFGNGGCYPMRKDVAESTAFQNSANASTRALLQAGDPENFYTMAGSTQEKQIFNKIAAEDHLVPFLQSADSSLLDFYLFSLKYSIMAQLLS